MGGGGKAESTPWRGPAGAQRPPLGGGYSALGTRGQSPWRSRTIKRTEAISLPQPQRGTGNGTLARRDADGRCVGKPSARQGCCACKAQRRPSKRGRARRLPGKERGKSASGSARKRRALRSAQRGTERVLNPSRSFYGRPSPSPSAPDRHPNGPGLQARFAQRIERVARRAAQHVPKFQTLRFEEFSLFRDANRAKYLKQIGQVRQSTRSSMRNVRV